MHVFTTSRRLAHSPAAVFAAMRDPERLARWWGPQGFRNVFECFEFQPGGAWCFEMIGPDGVRYPNRARFQRIEADRQVVIEHVNAPLFELSITLEALSEGTLLHWRQAFDDAALAQTLAPIVVPANEQNLDRLSLELNSAQRAT